MVWGRGDEEEPRWGTMESDAFTLKATQGAGRENGGGPVGTLALP